MSSVPTPRPEYPRPQFVRHDWLNLNGEWEFAFDDANVGLTEGWCDGRALDRRIIVPFPYQTELSGINDRSIHEVVWYARDFEVPTEWIGPDILLNFGAVDFQTAVWVNGVEVGHNRGGHVPFWFNIQPYLKPGKNRLTLRVVDSQNPKQARGKQSATGEPSAIDYYCSTGIWQTVWLEPAPVMRIDELAITTDYASGSIRLTAYLHAPAMGWSLEVDVYDGERLVHRARGGTAGAVVDVNIYVPNARSWSPEDPHLYDLQVRLMYGDHIIDQVKSYAGIRSVSTENDRFYLNGKPYYLVMVLDQGYWPESYIAAPSDEALRADVEWTLKFGFNGSRKHQKMEDPRWLYWCDKLGLIVWGEMANSREWSTEAEEQLTAEWQRAVVRDRNHPCVVAWVPVNESWGFPGLEQNHPGQYAFLERIVSATRRLDPTRPVIDNDGWEHTDITDILAIHDYSHDAEKLLERYKETLAGGPLPTFTWLGNRAVFARGSCYHGQPVMLTEVGGFLLLPNLPQEELDMLYGFYDSFKTPDELMAKYEDLMEGLAQLHFVSGFCYTQLTDIEQEINGLMTYDRKPKIDPERVAAAHRKLLAAVNGSA